MDLRFKCRTFHALNLLAIRYLNNKRVMIKGGVQSRMFLTLINKMFQKWLIAWDSKVSGANLKLLRQFASQRLLQVFFGSLRRNYPIFYVSHKVEHSELMKLQFPMIKTWGNTVVSRRCNNCLWQINAWTPGIENFLFTSRFQWLLEGFNSMAFQNSPIPSLVPFRLTCERLRITVNDLKSSIICN